MLNLLPDKWQTVNKCVGFQQPLPLLLCHSEVRPVTFMTSLSPSPCAPRVSVLTELATSKGIDPLLGKASLQLPL